MFQGVQDQKQHGGPEQFRSHHCPYQQHIKVSKFAFSNFLYQVVVSIAFH